MKPFQEANQWLCSFLIPVPFRSDFVINVVTYEQDLNLEGNCVNYENVLGPYKTQNMFDTIVLLGHLIVQQGGQSHPNLMVRNSQSSVTPMVPPR